MYNRVREYTVVRPNYAPYTSSYLYQKTASNPELCTPMEPVRVDTLIDTLCVAEVNMGIISDNVYKDASSYLYDIYGNRKAVKPRGPKRKSKLPRPFKACTHLRKKVLPIPQSATFLRDKTYDDSLCIYDYSITEMATPEAWIAARFGYEESKSLLLDGTPPNLDNLSFTGPDWFQLVSEFNESIETLIPSEFFSGEAAVEGAIYWQALKFIVNPRKALTSFFSNVVKRGLHRKKLGEIDDHFRKEMRLEARRNTPLLGHKHRFSSYEDIVRRLKTDPYGHLARETASAHLGYMFGVKPALEQIVQTIDAHSAVDTRLNWLNNNAGKYVPIRVRKVIKNDFSDEIGYTPFVDLLLRQSSQRTVACLSAMGRVRKDINEASRFRAYAEYFGLNKIVGTAWELIPFSFVVDWFTNAQEKINDLTRIPFGEGPFYNLVSIGSSIKKSATWDLCINPGYDFTVDMTMRSPADPLPALRCEVSEYTRIPGVPETPGVINVDVSSLGLFHGITAGELLLQKIL
jgi:hypothetical protein